MVNMPNSNKANVILKLSLKLAGILNWFCLDRMFTFWIVCSIHFLILAMF